MYIEGGRFENLKKAEFQPIPGYADYDRAPIQVTSQTAALLKLMANHGLPDTTLAFSYLRDFTLPYIRRAKDGFNDYFTRRYPPIMADINPEIITKPPPDLETREAIDHMAVVMSHMHDVIKIRQLPMGFSRRGMLGYPETRRGFEKRLLEMEKVIEGIIDGRLNLGNKKIGTPVFRTYAFFETAQVLPFVYPKSKAEIKDADEYLKRLKVDDVLEQDQLQTEGIHESLIPYQGNLYDLEDRTTFNHFVEDVGGLDDFGELPSTPVPKINQPMYENNLESNTPFQERWKRREKVQKMVEGIDDIDPDVSIKSLKFRAEIIKREEKKTLERARFNRLVEGVDLTGIAQKIGSGQEDEYLVKDRPQQIFKQQLEISISYPEPKGKPVTQEESAILERMFEGSDIDLTLNPEPDQIRPADMKLLPPGKVVVIDENQIPRYKNRKERRMFKNNKRRQIKTLNKLFFKTDPRLLDPNLDPRKVKSIIDEETTRKRLLENVEIDLGEEVPGLNEGINTEYNI